MTATETAAKAAYNSPRKRNIQEEMKKGGKKKEVFLSLADFSKVVPPHCSIPIYKKNNVHIKEKHSNDLIGRDSDTKINWHNTESP